MSTPPPPAVPPESTLVVCAIFLFSSLYFSECSRSVFSRVRHLCDHGSIPGDHLWWAVGGRQSSTNQPRWTITVHASRSHGCVPSGRPCSSWRSTSRIDIGVTEASRASKGLDADHNARQRPARMFMYDMPGLDESLSFFRGTKGISQGDLDCVDGCCTILHGSDPLASIFVKATIILTVWEIFTWKFDKACPSPAAVT